MMKRYNIVASLSKHTKITLEMGRNHHESRTWKNVDSSDGGNRYKYFVESIIKKEGGGTRMWKNVDYWVSGQTQTWQAGQRRPGSKDLDLMFCTVSPFHSINTTLSPSSSLSQYLSSVYLRRIIYHTTGHISPLLWTCGWFPGIMISKAFSQQNARTGPNYRRSG